MATPHYTQRVKLEIFAFNKKGELLASGKLHCKIDSLLNGEMMHLKRRLEEEYKQAIYFEFLDASSGDLITNSVHLNEFMK